MYAAKPKAALPARRITQYHHHTIWSDRPDSGSEYEWGGDVDDEHDLQCQNGDDNEDDEADANFG